MQIKIYVVDLTIPPRVKRLALRIGIPLAVLALGGVAFADLPTSTEYGPGQPLTAQALTDNFNYLQNEIAGSSGDGGLLNPPSLRYTLLSTATPGNNNTTIGSWTPVFDNYAAFDASTGIFTAPVAGTYLVTTAIQWSGVTSGFSFSLLIDGSPALGPNAPFLDRFDTAPAGLTVLMQHGTYTVHLAAGNTIYVIANTDGTATIGGDARMNYIQINRLGG